MSTIPPPARKAPKYTFGLPEQELEATDTVLQDMDTATFEAMRAAMDHRFGPWAVSLALQARRPHADARSESQAAIERLLADGDLILFRVPFAWGIQEALSHEDAKFALLDERHWRPRRIGSRRLVRLAATETGRKKFLAGAFGSPEPIQRRFASAYDVMVLEPLTCSEAGAMFMAFAGFLLGGFVGAVIGGAELGRISAGGVVGMALGSILGLGGAVSLWRKLYPAPAQSLLSSDATNIIPDQYMQGPTLDPNDEFGEPRF